MALFILMHLEAQRTHNDDEERARVKLDLLLRLQARKLDEDDMRHWHRFLAWFLDLPPALDDRVFAKARVLTQEDKAMGPVGYAERYELRGRIEGLLAGLEALLEAKFQEAGIALMPEVRKIEEADRLAAFLQAVRKARSLDEVRALLPPPADGPAS